MESAAEQASSTSSAESVPVALPGTRRLLGRGPLAGTRSVGNPLLAAELRRWRSRPLVYLGIAGLLTALIAATHYIRTSAPRFGMPGQIEFYLEMMVGLLLRPSSIVPAIMVWRAIYSFRDGPMFEPFRTTYITPSMFVRGIVAIPFAISALALVCYVGIYLSPNIINRWSANVALMRMEEFRAWLIPTIQIGGILFEGVSNGLLISLFAFYFSVRYNATLRSIGYTAMACVAIQTVHIFADGFAYWMLFQIERTLAENFGYLGYESWLDLVAIGVVKYAAAVAVWWRIVAYLRVVRD